MKCEMRSSLALRVVIAFCKRVDMGFWHAKYFFKAVGLQAGRQHGAAHHGSAHAGRVLILRQQRLTLDGLERCKNIISAV